MDDVVLKFQRGKVATSVRACDSSKRSASWHVMGWGCWLGCWMGCWGEGSFNRCSPKKKTAGIFFGCCFFFPEKKTCDGLLAIEISA